MPASVARRLRRLLLTHRRPAMRQLISDLSRYCEARGYRTPARATIYNFMQSMPGHMYAVRDIPQDVRDSLYNVAETGEISGQQLVFYAVNYGSTRALSFVAGLPWLDLYQAARMRGFHPKSLALLRALMRVRQI